MQEDPRTVQQEILDEMAVARRLRGFAPLRPVAGDMRSSSLEAEVPPFRTREDRTYRLEELTAYNDQEFVTIAYQALMGRAPDPTGRALFVEQLRAGRLEKFEVLGRLLYCDEGRKHGARVAGLGWRFHLTRLFRVPIVGYVARSLVALATLPRFRQEFLASENHLSRRIDGVRRGARIDLQCVEGRIAELSAAVDRQRDSMAAPVAVLEDFYLAFDTRFSVEPALVQSRLAAYLPYVGESPAAAQLPVLDIGCGRGAWLEVLGKAGYRAMGLDSNQAMVDFCTAAGLDVICSDAIAHLRGLPSCSLAAVTCFHVLEHMPFDAVIALFDEILRVLVPDGMVIFETPDPESVLVGAGNFYLDPRRIKPLAPDVLQFVAEHRGYRSCRILRLHPRDTAGGPESAEDVRRLFGSGMDYALIARKP